MGFYYEKSVKFLVEGKFLRKAFNKCVITLEKSLGKLTRYVVFRNSPVQSNKILMLTQQGDYTCNLKFITEELLKENVDCEIVWAVRIQQLRKAYELPQSNKIRLVNRFTYDFYKELATSKIWIINSVDPFKNPLKKKKNQVLIQTWHGSLGIKRFDKNVFNGREWVKAAVLCGKETDYCISNSVFEDKVYKETYWEKTPILQYGHPRNDVFFYDENQIKPIKEKIRDIYKLSDNKRYVLYAPTFRDHHGFECYNLDYQALINELEKKFGGEWGVLVRFHLNVRRFSKNVLEKNENIIDVTGYPDIQDIMLVSDIAITDYSSWIYDFVLTRKPGFIFATDIEDYNNERGFYYKLEETPFLVATNNSELIRNIKKFDMDVYKDKVEAFLSDKGCIEDGKASYRVVEKIKEIINM